MSSSIAQKLARAISYKNAIKAAIIDMGVTVGNDMSTYANAIRSIEGGVPAGSNTLKAEVLLRSAYDALASKDDGTLYLIVNSSGEIIAIYLGDMPFKFVSYG